MFPIFLSIPAQGIKAIWCLETRTEADQVRILSSHLRVSEVFVDIGAFRGDFSVLAAEKGCRVYAFEPTQDSFSRLAARAASLPGIHCHNTALGAAPERQVRLFLRKEPEANSVVESPETIGLPSQVVTYARLDEFGLAPDWIKIDVEKDELSVLRGGIQTLKRHRPLVLLEYHMCGLYRDTRRFLEDLGYRVKVLHADPRKPYWGHFLAAHAEQIAAKPWLREEFHGSEVALSQSPTLPIDRDTPLKELHGSFPGAAAALFSDHHIGCSICGIDDVQTIGEALTLSGVSDISRALAPLGRAEADARRLQAAPDDVAKAIAGHVRMIDVRPHGNQRSKRPPGALIGDQTLGAEILETWDKETPFILFCDDGIRSLYVASHLKTEGFINARWSALTL